MHKILQLALVLVGLAFHLSACGSSDGGNEFSQNPPSSQATPGLPNSLIENPQSGATLGKDTNLSIAINAYDAQAVNQGTVRIVTSSQTVNEGDVVQVQFERVGGTAGAVSVDWGTLQNTALKDQDYGGQLETLNWPDGVGGIITRSVTIINDTQEEAAENFRIVILNGQGGVSIDSDAAEATLIIAANDASSGSGYLATTTSSDIIVQNSITWELDTNYEVGEFISGVKFIVDPGAGVTIKSKTPALSSGWHGSMVNQTTTTTQGYDGAIPGYSASLSETYPLTLHGGDVLVGVVSDHSYPFRDSIGILHNKQHSYVSDASVIHIVSSIPFADQFSPGYVGAGPNRPVYRYSDINTSLLPQVSSAYKPSTNVIDDALGWFGGTWLDSKSYWTSRFLHPIHQMPNYGQGIGEAISAGAILMCMDFTEAQLKPLIIRYVQYGIDTYHNLGIGISYAADGGHASGRILPVLIAGRLLGHSGMLSSGPSMAGWGENGETYYSYGPYKVHSNNPGQDAVAFWGKLKDEDDFYQCGCYSSCSGNKIAAPLARNDDGCAGSGYRNCCTSKVWPGQQLAAMMFNVKTEWGHDEFFDYCDRFMGYGLDVPVVGGGNATSNGFTWVTDFWYEQRGNY